MVLVCTKLPCSESPLHDQENCVRLMHPLGMLFAHIIMQGHVLLGQERKIANKQR